MKLTRTRIAEVIASRTLDKGISKAYIQALAAYLLAERRVHELPSLLRDIQENWAQAGHVEAVASSAYPLSKHIKDEITTHVRKAYPGVKKISITTVIEPNLVGGVRVNLPHRQLDLSIASKLHALKQLTTTGKG